jgi:hypothetical protein
MAGHLSIMDIKNKYQTWKVVKSEGNLPILLNSADIAQLAEQLSCKE